tara:strand:- start:3667 stop:4437 length:771 start_codon:yes stop_codon:yes gene_type:complete
MLFKAKKNKKQDTVKDVSIPKLETDVKENSLPAILSLSTISAWRRLAIFLLSAVVLLTASNIFLAVGYYFIYPLKETKYLTVGYKVTPEGVEVVDVTPEGRLTVPQLRLLAKYFIEDTVVKALSNYRDERLLRADLSVVKSRVNDKVYSQITSIHREFLKLTHIDTRQIIINESKSDGYDVNSRTYGWIINFTTVDENETHQVFKKNFTAKISFKLLGFNDAEKLAMTAGLIKENINPLGLKIVGFYKLEDNKEKK